jgi:hypothetical protein
MKYRVATLLIGDVTPDGVVKTIRATRLNNSITVYFEDGSFKTYTKFAEIEVLNAK